MPKRLTIILLLCFHFSAFAQPVAQFSADKTGGCGPLVVHFADQTSLAGASAAYQWDFGNGNSSVLADPVATYTQPGAYTVTLTVQIGSQTSSASRIINVFPPPTASFTVADPRVCSPASVTFNAVAAAGSASIANYLWDFGDGSTSTVIAASTAHAYEPAGVYTVNLTVTDVHGCAATAAQKGAVTVLPELTPSFSLSPKVLCTVNSPVSFTNTTTGSGTLSYQWNFGDGGSSTAASPTHAYGVKGNYSVILTVTSSLGCVSADTQASVLNVANFQTDFTVPSSVCQGAAAMFTDSSSPAPTMESWVVDGSAAGTGMAMSNTFTAAGTHTITLTNTYGTCTQAVKHTFTVNASPVMPPFDAVQQTACGAPMTVNFLDHTPGAVAWAWNFYYQPYNQYPAITPGGPAISTVYPENETYQVQLTVTNSQGCQSSETQSVIVTSPYAGIVTTAGTPSVCGQPMIETFGTASMPNLTSWEWVFGDGDSSNAQTPTHTFSKSGNYQTFLRWSDKNGCSGISNILYTTITPQFTNIDFTADATTVCAGQAVTFGGPSLLTDNALFTSWNFGDGTPNTFGQTGAYHVYTTPGVYTVTLSLGSAGNCDTMIIKTDYITVLPSPSVSFTAAATCDSPRSTVVITPTVGNGATSVQWNYNDNGPVTDTRPANNDTIMHNYTYDGLFNITATATNGTCTTSSTVGVVVELKPLDFHLGIDLKTICPATSVSDSLEQTLPKGNPYVDAYAYSNLNWYYGDGTPFTGPQNWVNLPSWYGFYSSVLSGFEAGETGLYAVTTNFAGCKDTTNTVPLVVGGVSAAYQIIQDDQCYQQPVILQDVSKTVPGDPITSWLWDFGDGITSTASGTVQHIYANPGTYTVRLTVTDQGGCTSNALAAVSQVTVDGPKTIFQAIGGATAFPQGSSVQFVNNTNAANTANPVYNWNFGDQSTSTQVNPAHTYSMPGVYTVTLTAQDGTAGCVSIATLVITIQPVNNAFTKAASYVASGSCPPVLAQFTNTSVNYVSYTWDFGDGETVSNVGAPSHVYQKPGTYIVTLTVLEANGQTTTTVDSVIVLQPVAVLSAAVPAICQGDSVGFGSADDQRVKSYSWDFGDGSVITNGDSTVSHVYPTAGTYHAKLVVTDSLGCAAAASSIDAIDVHAPPVITLTPPKAALCLGSAVSLSVSSGTGVTYSWSPPTGLSSVNTSTPSASPIVNTIYTVNVADAIGCSDSGTIAVTVIRPDSVQATPDSASICPGQEVKLHASGAYSYAWYGENLSGSGPTDEIGRPTRSQSYLVVGSDSAGCFSDTASIPVTVLAQPTVNAGPDLDVLADMPVTIAAVGSGDVVGWVWVPPTDLSCADCAQPVCTPKQEEHYIVTVTAADGCTASDTVVVKLICDETKVRIPDAFTPNGDGHNDRFTVRGAITMVNHLAIYDRWGIKVFEADHFYPAAPGSGWDGTVGGRPAPAGVYAYFAELQCPAGGVFMMKGTVVLVR